MPTENIVRVAVLTALFAGSLLAMNTFAHPAWGIAVDGQGLVYFSDLKSVWKIDTDGKVSIFRRGTDSHTHELHVDEAGNVYGAENSYDPATKKFYGGIWRMTPAGEFSYVVPMAEQLPPGTSIWKDKEGNSYHVGSFAGRAPLVLKRAADGRVTVLAGSAAAVREYKQTMPYGVGAGAFGPDGSFYFLHGPNVSRVAARTGRVEPVAANVKGEGDQPAILLGLTVDATGNAYTADFVGRRVIKIAPGGRQTIMLRTEAPWNPSGVASRGGDLFVLESETAPDGGPAAGTRVRKVDASGRSTIIAHVEDGRTVSGTDAAAQNPPTDDPAASPPLETPRENFSSGQLFAALSATALLLVIGWAVGRRAFAGRT